MQWIVLTASSAHMHTGCAAHLFVPSDCQMRTLGIVSGLSGEGELGCERMCVCASGSMSKYLTQCLLHLVMHVNDTVTRLVQVCLQQSQLVGVTP